MLIKNPPTLTIKDGGFFCSLSIGGPMSTIMRVYHSEIRNPRCNFKLNLLHLYLTDLNNGLNISVIRYVGHNLFGMRAKSILEGL